MMGNLAIHTDELSKMYRIGVRQARYKTLRESLGATFASPFRRMGGLLSGRTNGALRLHETIWALKDVSFEVRHGEVIGIIGRNGAGKSTLLKILSRITEPTEGSARLFGRVGSLLEVGTGFHPELTGRENIYLNGAILGMRRREIERKFDEIVAFAEIEKFIDTPVKHYSSGMYVRLAFAVAAHLEPEILIIDEVLAVGDANFQRKCLGKMGDVAKEGRTVLFVSHNMGAVSTICERSLLLQDGKLSKDGVTEAVLPSYFESSHLNATSGVHIRSYIPGADKVSSEWTKDSYIAIEVYLDANKFVPGWQCDLACYTLDGAKLFVIQSQNLPAFNSHDPQKRCLTFFIENIGYSPRPLRVDVGIKRALNEPYNILIQNALLIMPASPNKSSYGNSNAATVPDIQFKLTRDRTLF